MDKIRFFCLMIICLFDLSCTTLVNQNITSYLPEETGNSVEYNKDKKYDIQCEDHEKTKDAIIAFLVDLPEGNLNAYTPYKIEDLTEKIKDQFQIPNALASNIKVFLRTNHQTKNVPLETYDFFSTLPKIEGPQIHLSLPNNCKIEPQKKRQAKTSPSKKSSSRVELQKTNIDQSSDQPTDQSSDQSTNQPTDQSPSKNPKTLTNHPKSTKMKKLP